MATTNKTTGVQINKTDLATAIRYLEGALKIYAADTSSRMQDRCRLLNKLINKLNSKLKTQ